MNADLLKQITDAMQAAALAVLERKTATGGIGRIECAIVADEISRNTAHAVAMFVDVKIDEIEREYTSTYGEIMRALEVAGIASTDEHDTILDLPARVRTLARRRPMFAPRPVEHQAMVAELASFADRGWRDINPLYIQRINEIREALGLPAVAS